LVVDENIVERLDRIELLLTVIAKASLAPVLASELAEARMATLYAMTGDVTAKEAARKLSCSLSTVSAAWQRWETLGLVRKVGKKYERSL